MGEFQAGLGTPEAAGLLAHFGLTATEVGVIAFCTFCTVALIKKHATITGPWLLVMSGLVCIVWSVLWYVPEIPKPVTAAVMAFITVSGGWQGFKDVTGKIQFGGTKPKGMADRGPTKPNGA